MKTLTPRISRPLAILSATVIALLPFHAFLSVWLSSFVGAYTGVRLWKEYILVVLVVGCAVLWLQNRGGRSKSLPAEKNVTKLTGTTEVKSAVSAKNEGAATGLLDPIMRQPLIALTVAYIALLILVGLAAHMSEAVSLRAYAYGVLLDARFLVFFLAVWLITRHNDLILAHWKRLLLIPAAVVVGFGLLQFTVLPADFLSHFGYGPQTIPAVQTVDDKEAYQRIQSTLRGANPLGAYLVIILAALGVLILARGDKIAGDVQKNPKKYVWVYVLLFAASCAVLAMTFSRSAWIGVVAAVGWLLWQSLRAARTRRLLLVAGGTAVLAFAAVGYGLRDNDTFQNAFFHTDENSQSATSSNQNRLQAMQGGIADIIRQPSGGGTGTAGPASAYNGRQGKLPRIAENYYVQIGQEVGIIGLGLFLAINLLVAKRLWQRRSQLLPQVLLASLIGISLINMLSHAWTDDTLAYIWWGLAGAAMVLPVGRALATDISHNSKRSILKHKHEQRQQRQDRPADQKTA